MGEIDDVIARLEELGATDPTASFVVMGYGPKDPCGGDCVACDAIRWVQEIRSALPALLAVAKAAKEEHLHHHVHDMEQTPTAALHLDSCRKCVTRKATAAALARLAEVTP